MKIEVLLPGQTPKIFHLIKKQMILGSSSECDIQIHFEGISKKHLLISEENNLFFITDLDSHNGTYLDGVKIKSGEKKEFNTSTPIVLSKDVLLSLILDDDVSEELIAESNHLDKAIMKESDKTKIFSLKELEENAKQDFLNKRKEIRRQNKYIYKNKSPQNSQKKLMFFLALFFVLALLGYFVQNKTQKNILSFTKENQNLNPKSEIKDKELANSINDSLVKGKFKGIDDKSIPLYGDFIEGFEKKKCSSTLEKEICLQFSLMDLKYSGVMEEGNKIFIYLHRGSYFKDTELLFPLASQDMNSSSISYSERIKLMFLIFLRSHPELNWNKHLNKDFYYIFYVNQGTGPMIFALFGTPSENLLTLKNDLTQEFLNKVRQMGSEAFIDIFDFFYVNHTKTVISADFDLYPQI